MYLILTIVCALVALQLVSPFVSVLLSSARTPHTHPHTHPHTPTPTHTFSCIITAYRNVEIARPLVTSLLTQTHPDLRIYLVADECPDTDMHFPDERFMLLQPEEPLRLKAKSIIYAMDRLVAEPDYVVIFDADNLAHPQFLEEINRMAAGAYACIQGRRTAKNLDSNYAALDSLGEHYKNHIEREVPFRLGGSAVISGSGMATRTDLYRAYLNSPEIEQGKHRWKKMLQEDKILQNFLLRRNERIAYARAAVVYDEKVESAEAVATQRSRWLYSYFQNIPNALGIMRRGILNGSFNQCYFGWVTLALPMFIQAGLGLLLAPFAGGLTAVALLVFGGNVLWVLRLDAAPPEVHRVVWLVPKFIFRQFLGLFRMRNPNKYFKHTEHRKIIDIDTVDRQKIDNQS